MNIWLWAPSLCVCHTSLSNTLTFSSSTHIAVTRKKWAQGCSPQQPSSPPKAAAVPHYCSHPPEPPTLLSSPCLNWNYKHKEGRIVLYQSNRNPQWGGDFTAEPLHRQGARKQLKKDKCSLVYPNCCHYPLSHWPAWTVSVVWFHTFRRAPGRQVRTKGFHQPGATASSTSQHRTTPRTDQSHCADHASVAAQPGWPSLPSSQCWAALREPGV